jgi:protein TonB
MTSGSAAGPGGTGGWLGSQSVFDQGKKRKLSGPMLASVGFHGLVLLAIIAAGIHHVVTSKQNVPEKFDTVFLQQPGPGGGGGGSPAPAPPKKLEIPHPKPVESIPVPTPVPEVPPPPTLNAPVETNLAQTLQASGANNLSISALGGGGRGGGIGSGVGNGLGPGSGGGTGGGVFDIGNGVTAPVPIRQPDPAYTSEAMRAKMQGEVELDAVVQPNGLVTDIKVTKSLDRLYGLDQAAIDAAKKWLFRPCTKQGQPVACRISLVLEFRLH